MINDDFKTFKKEINNNKDTNKIEIDEKQEEDIKKTRSNKKLAITLLITLIFFLLINCILPCLTFECWKFPDSWGVSILIGATELLILLVVGRLADNNVLERIIIRTISSRR